MNCKFTFKKMDPSRELTEHAETVIGKLDKFKMKPIETVHVIFKSQVNGECEVEVVISGPQLALQANARGDNFFQAVDKAVERVSKQMARKKDKVQDHNPKRSA